MLKQYTFILILLFLAGCGGSTSTDEDESEGSVEEVDATTEESAERLHQEVITEDTVGIPAEELWQNIASLGGIENLLPDIFSNTQVEGSGVGATRTITFADGSGELLEEVTKLDNESMVLEYKIISGPLPLENYVGTMQVTSLEDGGTLLKWISEFDVTPENQGMKDQIKEIHNMLFNNLKNPEGSDS